jgi:hypothetical protein
MFLARVFKIYNRPCRDVSNMWGEAQVGVRGHAWDFGGLTERDNIDRALLNDLEVMVWVEQAI